MEVRTVADVSALVRGRRTDLNLSVSELARRAGVSRPWLIALEHGKAAGVDMRLVFAVLDTLGVTLNVDQPGVSGANTGLPTASADVEREGDEAAVDLDRVLDDYALG